MAGYKLVTYRSSEGARAGLVIEDNVFDAAKLTGKPEEAVAATLKSGSPNVLLAIAPNVIVWFAFAMLKLCGTFGAAL